jgi:hypothetical protein
MLVVLHPIKIIYYLIYSLTLQIKWLLFLTPDFTSPNYLFLIYVCILHGSQTEQLYFHIERNLSVLVFITESKFACYAVGTGSV